jgi:hypothetical protein
MGQFTICTELIKYCGKPKNVKYLTNILFVFTQENSHKICIDRGGTLLMEYKRIALKSESLRIWIDLLTSKKIPGIEYIKIENNHNTTVELLLSICTNSYDKSLVVNSKQDYTELREYINTNEINLIEKDLILEDFKGSKYNIVANEGSQVSLGEYSPNVINEKE